MPLASDVKARLRESLDRVEPGGGEAAQSVNATTSVRIEAPPAARRCGSTRHDALDGALTCALWSLRVKGASPPAVAGRT